MKRIKTIFLVTHGDKEKGPNPGMTKKGFTQVKKLIPELQRLLPNPAQIHAGTGLRHLDVVKALGFSVEEVDFSVLWGSPESLEKPPEGKMIILADGTAIVYKKFLTIKHLARVISKIIAELPPDALICAGRPVLVRLGRKSEDCESGAIYALHVMEDNSIEIELLVSGVNLDDEGAGV